MAFPHGPGLLPSEVAFLCEMEMVTVIPRQRLDRLLLLGGPTPALIPPQRTTLPLWFALLLKRQRRANIIPPPWLHPESLAEILELETKHFQESFSPAPRLATARATDYNGKGFFTSHPFAGGNVAEGVSVSVSKPGYGGIPYTQPQSETQIHAALPYHWYELSELLLDSAADDMVDPDNARLLLRDIREVRLAKMRKGVDVLTGDGDGVRLDGVGATEVAESRAFVTGVVDGLRRIGASREASRRERETEEREREGLNYGGRGAGSGGGGGGDGDEDMT